MEALAVMGDASGAETLQQHRQDLVVCASRLMQVATEPLVLHVAHATPDTRHEAAMRELVDHTEFLDQPGWMIQRQAQHHGAQPDPRRALRDRGKEHDRRWRHVERGEVVLRDVVAIEPVLLGALDQADTLIVLLP